MPPNETRPPGGGGRGITFAGDVSSETPRSVIPLRPRRKVRARRLCRWPGCRSADGPALGLSVRILLTALAVSAAVERLHTYAVHGGVQ